MIQHMEKTVSRNRKIALTGALCALVVVLGMPPLHLGMIPLGPNASITIMHIPVLLAVMLTGGVSALASGIAVGTVFGVFSLILAAITPTGALDPPFRFCRVRFLPQPLGFYGGFCRSFRICRKRFPPRLPRLFRRLRIRVLSSARCMSSPAAG